MTDADPTIRSPHPRSSSAPPRPLLLAALVLLCGVAVYLPTHSAKYIALDDPQYTIDNPYVMHPTWPKLVAFFTEVLKPTTVAGYYQPLAMASLTLDRVIEAKRAGDYAQLPEPFIFHVHNTILHGLNAGLIVLLVWHIVHRRWIALVAGLLFALHPYNVEAVAWICQRKALLSTTFALLTFMTYGRWARTHQFGWYATALFCFLLSLLAKPTSMFLPAVLVLGDIWPLRRVGPASDVQAPGMSAQLARLVIEKLPFFALGILFGWIAYVSQERSFGAMEVLAKTDTWRTLLITGHNVFFYLLKSIVPYGLCPQYPLPPDALIKLTAPNFAIGVLGAAAIALFIVIAFIRGWRPVWTMLLGFYLLLAPSLGPVQFMGAIMGDRFAYTPMVMLIILAAEGLRRLAPSPQTNVRRPAWIAANALAVGVLIVFTLRTIDQQLLWKDSRSYYAAVRDRYPDDPSGYFGLGAAALFEHNTWLSDPDPADPTLGDRLLKDAFAYFQKTIELRESYTDAYYEMGEIYRLWGRPADALPLINKAASYYEEDRKAYFYRGLAYAQLGEDELAIEQYRKLLASWPNQREVLYNLGNALLRTATSLPDRTQKIARLEESLRCYERLYELDPYNQDGLQNWGTALATLGAYKDAIPRFIAAIRLRSERAAQLTGQRQAEEFSKLADAQFSLAGSLAATGQLEPALASLRQACAIKPELLDMAQRHPLFEQLRKSEAWPNPRPTTGPVGAMSDDDASDADP